MRSLKWKWKTHCVRKKALFWFSRLFLRGTSAEKAQNTWAEALKNKSTITKWQNAFFSNSIISIICGGLLKKATNITCCTIASTNLPRHENKRDFDTVQNCHPVVRLAGLIVTRSHPFRVISRIIKSLPYCNVGRLMKELKGRSAHKTQATQRLHWAANGVVCVFARVFFVYDRPQSIVAGI